MTTTRVSRRACSTPTPVVRRSRRSSSRVVPRRPARAQNDDALDETVLASSRRACLARVAVAATTLAHVSPSFARAFADPRTEVRREIRPSDFESLDAFERARSRRRPDATRDDARGIPVSLSSSGESEEDESGAMAYTEPPPRVVREVTGETRGAEARRAASAAFQWSVILGVAYAIRRAQTRSETVSKSLAKRFKYAETTPRALVGTKWRVTADVGRESGTWMPPNWAASGMRLVVPVAVEFKEGGVVEPIATGAFTPTTFAPGTWKIDGDTLRFNLKMVGGLSRGDVVFDEELLYFKTLVWGDKISANRGRLLVNQTRFFIRREWRSVGTFKVERVDEDAAANGAQLVPPMRVRVPE